MSRDDHAVQLIELAMAAKTKTKQLITALTKLPQGWVSARKHHCTTAITTMWTESLWAFPESYTADDSWIVRSINGNLRKTKVLITPQLRWVSAQFLYVESMHDGDHDNVVRIFVGLSCELGDLSI